MNREALGPAERIIASLLVYVDHLFHNRPGMVSPAPEQVVGVKWEPVTHKVENGEKVVYRLTKLGKKTIRTRVGAIGINGQIVEHGRLVGMYRSPGIFGEVAAWVYAQIASVWQMDNEFAARWASYAFGQEHRDMKVILAAFLLCQSRRGDAEKEGDAVLFHDEDYRAVGEAMLLLRADGKDFNPKMLLRVRDVLMVREVAEQNRKLGFGKSTRKPFLGRWSKAVEKWLRHREQNPKMLQGLIRQGFRRSVMTLAQQTGYKPISPRFFEMLRWKQKQSDDGRRDMALDLQIAAADSWDQLTEEQICERIVKERPSYKVVTGRVPASIGITRAIMAAAIESGSLSDKDLIIATPTLEDLGLLTVQEIKERWETALKKAEDQRASNIARNVRSKDVAEKLQEGADAAVQKAVTEVMRDMRVYIFVDISGSMDQAITKAKEHLEKFIQAFPADRLHVAVFNTVGREVKINHQSAKGVQAAFRGISANGGTSYGQGVLCLSKYLPKEEEDSLFIFVGDQQDGQYSFETQVRVSGLRPMAFGFVYVKGNAGDQLKSVENTASVLGIPCFRIEEATFADPYAIPRTIRALVASTPVGIRNKPVAVPRVTLVDQILQTELLKKPAWAA